MSKPIKVFLFGCWNKNSCLDKKNNDNRQFILELLTYQQPNYDMGILLGDNIYPLKTKQLKRKTKKSLTQKYLKMSKKVKKVKSFLKESEYFYQEIINITDYLTRDSSLDKKLHIILGNHDVENNCVLNNQIKNFTNDLCSIYEDNTILETENAFFIMLNTNNIENIIEFLENLVENTINFKNKWVIFCAHDPIISYKPKKKKIFQKIDNIDIVLEKIKNLHYKKILYICADTHNFQVINIFSLPEEDTDEFEIPIVVLGTGGANPDSLKDIEKYENSYDEKLDINIDILDYESPFGFADMDVFKNKIVLTYKKCEVHKIFILEYIPKKNILIITNKEKNFKCNIPEIRCVDDKKLLLEIC